LALTGVFMQGILRRLILMALLIPVGWRNESPAQTTAAAPPQKADEQEQRLRTIVSESMLREPDALVVEIESEYTLTYLSQKDEINRAANIPEILLARPGMSVFTRQAAKFKREAR
jgi:hypothetical protein